MINSDEEVAAMLQERAARQPNRAQRRANNLPNPPPLAGAVDLAPPPKVRLGSQAVAFVRSLDENGTYGGLVKRNPNQPNPQAPDSYSAVAEDGRAAFVDAEELAEMVAWRVITLLANYGVVDLPDTLAEAEASDGADAAAFTPAP